MSPCIALSRQADTAKSSRYVASWMRSGGESLLWRHAGLLPADSDYRMFSYKHYGSLPGLDIAFLLDGAAYHTDRDTVDRLRPGTLQVRCWASGFDSFRTPKRLYSASYI